jgi:2-methylaconitate cis-trans-isomerase PrpF
MGMGDVHESVTPKFGLIAPPKSGGTISARYFMPWACHPSMAVTGSQCLASCVLAPGTVAAGLARIPEGSPAQVVIEHPLGKIEVIVDYSGISEGFNLHSAGLIRTARKLVAGQVYIPAGLWA